MFFTLKEIVKWLGITSFEIWMHVVSVAVFSVLSVLKYEDMVDMTWWEAFTPLFICDGLCAYFCIIVFIRMYRDFGNLRPAIVRLLSSLLYVTLLFVFKILLSQKLSRVKIISNSEVMAPLFILLQIVMIRACQVH
ncbi:transmembrane protein 203-like [Pecten maximus]|uniref:transmembrane protein 203-like n=1 Tax=Pecten maximus TaxID=6579 RepID=UPI001457F86F|nr:transmembrane protein 203-like [Pecten maximus]